MRQDFLTAAFVEDLHHAILSGKSLDGILSAISPLRQATLTGLAEYACLQTIKPELPELPSAVAQTPRGSSFRAIMPANRDALKVHNLSMTPQPSEFVVFRSEEELLGDPIRFFQIRFNTSCQKAGFSKGISDCLYAGLNEMMDNAVRHAQATLPMIAGYAVGAKTAQFVVADVGGGILDTLRKPKRYQSLSSHADAIRLALHDGVTSDPEGRGGYGFRDIFKALAEQWGILRFRSGEGCVTMDGQSLDADRGTVTFPPPLPGFQVSVTCQSLGHIAQEPVI